MMLLQIDWNPSPILFKIGPVAIRYYSLMFVIAFMLGLHLMKKIFIKDKISLEKLDSLFLYAVIATLMGARLGHFIFYDPQFLIEKPLEVILPFRFSPKFEFTGFSGLASHGAAIGVIIAMYLFSKKVLKKPILFILDRIVVPVAIGAMFVRLGNLFNSEIIGKPTNSDYGFVFKRLGEDFPRHPAQLYEAICYLGIFIILWFVYWKTNKKEKLGYIFGLFFVLLWSVRFVIEFFKEAQVDDRASWALNTGQLLSIPLIFVGLYFMFRKTKA
ncbi:prolipoprotein diacylglyceryl transferase [Lutibacter sp.]